MCVTQYCQEKLFGIDPRSDGITFPTLDQRGSAGYHDGAFTRREPCGLMEDDRMKHTAEFLTAGDGHRIFTQWWAPDGVADATLVISHGYAEYGGRYAHVADFFSDSGFRVCALDHRSHGASDGEETFIRSFDVLLSDLDLMVGEARSAAPGKPVFLLGHSMGGAIAAAYAIKYQPALRGLLLSGPAVVFGGDISPLLIKLSGVLGAVAPRMKTITLDAESVSRDPEIVSSYKNDPHVYHGGIPARTGAELNKMTRYVQENLSRLTVPCFLANGSADKLVDPGVSRFISDRCGSSDKTVRVYEGLYHEILNEPEKDQVMSEMLGWMKQRLA